MATRQQYILHPCILRVIVAAFSGCWVMNVCVPLLYAVPVLIRYYRALTTLKPIGHESAEVNDEKRPSESLEFIYTHHHHNTAQRALSESTIVMWNAKNDANCGGTIQL